MDSRQRCLYLALKGDFQTVLRESSQSLYLLHAGKQAYWRGEYGYAMSCLQRGRIRRPERGACR